MPHDGMASPLVVRRRTEFELRKAEARAHILEGLTYWAERGNKRAQKLAQLSRDFAADAELARAMARVHLVEHALLARRAVRDTARRRPARRGTARRR